MSFLTDLWHNNWEINNPIHDIESLLLFSRPTIIKICNGVDRKGIPSYNTPLMLLWRQRIIPTDAIEKLLLLGADIDFFGSNGLNSLFIILLLLFYDKSYINHLDYWLSLGANPNKNYIYKCKTCLNSLEFFLFLLNNDDWNLDSFKLNFIHSEKLCLTELEIKRIIISLLIFNVELPVINTDRYVEECRNINIYNISNDMLNYYPMLEKKLYHVWNISFPISDFYMRHKFLSKYAHLILKDEDIVLHDEENTIIYTSSTTKQYYKLNKSRLYLLYENDKNFYFSSDLIPFMIKNGKNPLTNNSIPIDVRKNWIQKLVLENPPFEYKSLEESIQSFPNLFFNKTKLDDEIYLIEYLYNLIYTIHPYTNIMNLLNWNQKVIQYAIKIMTEGPYSLLHFKDVQNLHEFLLTIYNYILTEDSFDYINKIHFSLEEINEDYKVYHSIQSIFKKSKVDFIYVFHEAIMIPDVFDILIERIGVFDMNEMSLFYEKICKIRYLELDLTEDTFPILIQN